VPRSPLNSVQIPPNANSGRSDHLENPLCIPFGILKLRLEELPAVAVPELFHVSMPPLPRAAYDTEGGGDSNTDDGKNRNRGLHGNLLWRQNDKGARQNQGSP
jgi:hypothetical protein